MPSKSAGSADKIKFLEQNNIIVYTVPLSFTMLARGFSL